MTRKLSDVLTIGEVAALASRLDRVECTARRARYLLSLGKRDGERQLVPPRLYRASAVALVRVALQLEKNGVSAWVARVVVAYLREQLVGAFEGRARVAVRLVGVRGELVADTVVERERPHTAFIALRELWDPIHGEVRQIRRERPSVWKWRELPVSALTMEAVTA